MPREKVLALRIRRNRQKVAMAGIPGPHVVTAIVSLVERAAATNRDSPPGKRLRKRELVLDVVGLVSPEREHVRWASVALKAGDRVTIEVIEVAGVDSPKGHSKGWFRELRNKRLENAEVRRRLVKL